ncbi:MAG: hypothetical protein ACRDQ4_10305 [Pseudonocardiaceae bacterium]
MNSSPNFAVQHCRDDFIQGVDHPGDRGLADPEYDAGDLLSAMMPIGEKRGSHRLETVPSHAAHAQDANHDPTHQLEDLLVHTGLSQPQPAMAATYYN